MFCQRHGPNAKKVPISDQFGGVLGGQDTLTLRRLKRRVDVRQIHRAQSVRLFLL